MLQINSNYMKSNVTSFRREKEQIFEKRNKITQFAMEKCSKCKFKFDE